MPSIKAIACVLPKKKIENKYFYKNFEKEHLNSAFKIVGVKNRFWAESEDTLSLCVSAAENLFSALMEKNINIRNKIDLLIFVTQTPSSMMPAIAYDAHSKLNLTDNCGCYSLNAGCTGYVEGIGLMYDLINAREYKNGLLLVGDTLSNYLDKQDSSTTPIFGDAGTATWVSSQDKENKYLFLNGTKPKSTNAISLNNKSFLKMKGLDVFNFTINGIPKFINSIKVKWEEKYKINFDPDFYLFHQANNLIINHIIKKLKLDQKKVPMNIHEYGNTSGATIPLLLASLINNKKENKSFSALFCGFGVGLSWAALMINSVEIILVNIKENKS